MQIAIETRHACIDVGMRVIEHIIRELADVVPAAFQQVLIAYWAAKIEAL
jgi:hypothetical protein